MAELVFQRSSEQAFICLDYDAAKKLPNQFVATVKNQRNPQFHRKVFLFFRFCFQHWNSDKEFMDEEGQFDVFRKNLTALAGYYDKYYSIKGDVRIEAKSLSYANMTQDEFKSVYSALINAAMNHIFKDCGKDTENKLMSFF